MQELITISGHGVHVLLAKQPVSRGNYKQYLHNTGQPLPAVLARPEPPAAPIAYISQAAALDFCRWLGPQEGRRYRLPTMAELEELFSVDMTDGFSPELWAHHAGQRPELRGGLKQVYLCEWTAEIEEISQHGDRAPRRLGSIFYPPWLRGGNNAAHAHAALSASEGYSFVTFRVACDG